MRSVRVRRLRRERGCVLGCESVIGAFELSRLFVVIPAFVGMTMGAWMTWFHL
jgi:hypothetical protein